MEGRRASGYGSVGALGRQLPRATRTLRRGTPRYEGDRRWRTHITNSPRAHTPLRARKMSEVVTQPAWYQLSRHVSGSSVSTLGRRQKVWYNAAAVQQHGEARGIRAKSKNRGTIRSEA